jgi:hypothetical protein
MTDKQLSHDLSGRIGVDQALKLNTLDFISQHGSVLDALMYSRLFWLEFVEIDDMIFLKEVVEDETDRKCLTEMLDSYSGDKSLAEESLNLLYLRDEIGDGDATDEQVLALSERIESIWRARLLLAYPGRRFEVQVQFEDDKGDLAVTFYRERGAPRPRAPLVWEARKPGGRLKVRLARQDEIPGD